MKIRSILLLSLGIPFVSEAQSIGPDILNSTGGSATLNNQTFEWSIGESIATHTAISNNLVITHGVLQPIIVQEDTSHIKTPKLADFQISVYPNPSEDNLYIKLNLSAATTLSYVLYDMQGRVMLEKKELRIEPAAVELISLNKLAAASYMLKIHCVVNGRHYYNNYTIQKV